MSIAALFFAIAVGLVAAAILSLSPMIWFSLGVACAALGVIAAKSNIKRTPAKWALAVGGSVLVVALVMTVHVFNFLEFEVFGPVREGNAAQASIETLLGGNDPKRFSKALAVAQSVQTLDRRRYLTTDVYYKLDGLSGVEPLDETELEAAISAARSVNVCPDFVPVVILRRMQPSDLSRVLQTFPNRTSCAGLDARLLARVIDRCNGPWRGRCAQELPREALIAQTEPAGRVNAIRQLIKAVWPQHRLEN
jgi:hypothetical protein